MSTRARWLLLVALALAVGLSLGLATQHSAAAAPSGSENPFQTHALAPNARRWLSATIEERVPAGPYVYLRVREQTGQLAWLVALKSLTPDTSDVRALVVGQAEQFHSRRLDRDFQPLLFAAVRAAH